MFENMTYENILEDMLSRVNNDIDKREGSIIYDALAPAAFKLAETYYKLNNYRDLLFIDTTVGEYLDLKALDYGITRKEATSSIREIETTGPVSIGTRWGLNNLVYTITKEIKINTYQATCQQTGEIGNSNSGELENIDNVMGVTAVLTSILEYGADEETDNQLRMRVNQQLIKPAQDGNIAQYLKWALDYPGIGTAKVFPLWKGTNTVKVAITNSVYQPAETLLIKNFQSYIDPGASGLGNGVAPIGSKVTISGGTKKSINITANIMLNEGYSEPTGAAEAISNYLASIVYKKNSVSYMRIGSALLDCPSILDLNSLKMNTTSEDVALIDDEIPVLGSLNLVVTT